MLSRSTIGIAKASVLPEPVGLLARTSPPCSASGMTSAWIWNGYVDVALRENVSYGLGHPEGTKIGQVGLQLLGRRDRVLRRRDLTGMRPIRIP